MRGPSAPRPAGTMRAPRAKLMRARRSSSRLGRREEDLAEAERHRAGDDGEAEVEQHADVGHRATDEPARALPHRERRVGRRAGPVIAAMARPDASASRQPRLPHGHGRPSGSTMRWPTWPALPSAPSSSRPSSTMPPPTPVLTTMARKSAHPPGRAAPALAEGQRLGVVVDHHRQPGQLRQPRAQREVPPAGDVERRDELTARPSSARRSPRRPRPDGAPTAPLERRPSRARARPGQGSARSVGRSVADQRAAVVVDQADGQLGPADVDREVGPHGPDCRMTAC